MPNKTPTTPKRSMTTVGDRPRRSIIRAQVEAETHLKTFASFAARHPTGTLVTAFVAGLIAARVFQQLD